MLSPPKQHTCLCCKRSASANSRSIKSWERTCTTLTTRFSETTASLCHSVVTALCANNNNNNNTNVLFTRPPQLGKTMLLSLAELLLSNTETALTGLESYPPDEVNNSWYAITFNLGGVGFTGGAEAKSRPEKSIKRFATPSSVASPVSCQSTGR